MKKAQKAQKLRNYLIEKKIQKGKQGIETLIQECHCNVQDIIVIALKNNNLEAIKYLIENKEIDLQNEFGYYLLYKSIKDKNYAMSAYLLDQKKIPTKINGLEIKESSIQKIRRKEKIRKVQKTIRKFIKKIS